MNLEALLAPIPDKTKRAPCKVGRVLESLEEPYRTAFVGLLDFAYAEGGLSDEALADRTAEAGIPISATGLNRHRRGRCSCERQLVG